MIMIGIVIIPAIKISANTWEQGKPYKLSGNDVRSRKPQGGQWFRGYRYTEPGRSESLPVPTFICAVKGSVNRKRVWLWSNSPIGASLMS